MLKKMICQIFKGYSLARAWMNCQIENVTAEGVILDIGSGSSDHMSMIRKRARAYCMTTDRRMTGKPTFVSDIEKALPLKERSIDVVLLFNVLEHVYNYRILIEETGRVLKPGGCFYLSVPFLYPHHTAQYPDFTVEDYFRFGPVTVTRLLKEQGIFRGPIEITVFGGPFTAGFGTIASAAPFAWLRFLINVAGLLLDRVFFLFKKKEIVQPTEWPVVYWFKAIK